MNNKKIKMGSALVLALATIFVRPNLSYANNLDNNIKEELEVQNSSELKNLSDENVNLNEGKNIESTNEDKNIVNYAALNNNEEKLSLDKYKEEENNRLNKRLNKVIDEETRRLEGDWQVAIDTVKGESDIDIDRKSKSNKKSQPSASTIKVFVALEAYKQVEEGKLSENSIKNDVYYMLKDSDNSCANRLIDKVGINNVDKTIKNVTGRNITDLNRKMLQAGKQNMASAKDLNTALKTIVNGDYISKANSKKLETALSANDTTSRTKILANLPKNAKGFNKSGTLANIGVQNDAAVISTGNSQYALSVLSDYPYPTSWSDGPQFTTLRNLGRRTAQEFDLFNKRINSYRIVEEEIPFSTKEVLNHKEDKTYKKTLNEGSKGKIKRIIFKDPNTGKESIIEEIRKNAIDKIIEIGTNKENEERERRELEEKNLKDVKDNIIKELESYNINSDLFLGQIKRAKTVRSAEILKATILKVNGITEEDKKEESKEERTDEKQQSNDKNEVKENLEEKKDNKEDEHVDSLESIKIKTINILIDNNIESDLYLGQIRRAKTIRSVEILRDSILKVNGLNKEELIIKDDLKSNKDDEVLKENEEDKDYVLDKDIKDNHKTEIKALSDLEKSKEDAINELKNKKITSDLFLGQIRRANSEKSVEILKNTIIKVYFK